MVGTNWHSIGMLGTKLTQLKDYESNWNMIYRIGIKYVIYPLFFFEGEYVIYPNLYYDRNST